ncbi:hypothetical protein, unlikely [Trypanosoma congolense IL3000]|uniref:Uncharacterized protein n=1 Tax=Trypanosoma congolense (strain IL3000) TaxID=1068625 RepID=F9W3B2_TRYCI|nr:hypothetical protein, unlikely [Trypanosoma congolense IL3000]
MRVLVFSMLLLLLFIIIIIVFFQMVLQGLVPVTFSHGIVVNIHVPPVVMPTTGNAGADFSPRMANGLGSPMLHTWLAAKAPLARCAMPCLSSSHTALVLCVLCSVCMDRCWDRGVMRYGSDKGVLSRNPRKHESIYPGL